MNVLCRQTHFMGVRKGKNRIIKYIPWCDCHFYMTKHLQRNIDSSKICDVFNRLPWQIRDDSEGILGYSSIISQQFFIILRLACILSQLLVVSDLCRGDNNFSSFVKIYASSVLQRERLQTNWCAPDPPKFYKQKRWKVLPNALYHWILVSRLLLGILFVSISTSFDLEEPGPP